MFAWQADAELAHTQQKELRAELAILQCAIGEAVKMLREADAIRYDDTRIHALLDRVEGVLLPFAPTDDAGCNAADAAG
jgi:hypothetical protein